MLEAPAATMPSPKLKYGNETFTPTNSSWNLANLKFLVTNSKTIFKMCIIAVPERDEDSLLTGAKITESLKAFQKSLQGTYRVATFQQVGVVKIHSANYLATVDAEVAKAKSKGANLVMLLLEKKSIPFYNLFRQLADCEHGLQSLCVIYDQKNHCSQQYWGNEALKVNLKAGGINHTVVGIDAIMKNTLVLGA
jgi:eukaryotic translation initiation factor 2C